jgi:hypothetical protein
MPGESNGREKRPRATDAELAARVEEVLYARLAGAEFHDLQGLAKEKGWNVSDRQLWRYVALADARMEEAFQADREKAFCRHVLQRRALYARAMQDGDWRTCLAIAKDEAELLGLYPAKVTKLQGDPNAPLSVNVEMTVDERDAALSRILSRFGLAPGGIGSALADRNGSGTTDRPLLGGPGPLDG